MIIKIHILAKPVHSPLGGYQLDQPMFKNYFIKMALSLLVVILAGCTTVTSHQKVMQKNSIEEGENIAVSLVLVKKGDLRLEKKICEKTRKSLELAGFKGRLVAGEDFRRLALADLNEHTGSQYPDNFLEILHNESFQRNIESLNLRFVVLVSVKNEHVIDEQSTSDALLLYSLIVSGEKSTYLKGQVFDLKLKKLAGEIYIGADGGYAYGLVFGIVPVVVPSTTKSSACKRFSEAIANFIMGANSEEK